jgi:hypothetical protein
VVADFFPEGVEFFLDGGGHASTMVKPRMGNEEDG